MGSLHHFGRAVLLGGAALILPLAAGCSGASGDAADTHAGHAKAAPATIEQLADKTGCTLTGKRAADELKQGACQTAKGRYTLVGFSTDQGLQSWLKEAKPWGGTYLVGTRWIVVGTKPILESLRKDVGGQITSGAHHGG